LALVALATLIFCWPFVRTPPLGLLETYLHLLAAWAVVVAATLATARSLGRHPPDE
jgi:hypothetical protein